MGLNGEHVVKFGEYETDVGAQSVERIVTKAKRLRNKHVAHLNSTYYGGGVAQLLSCLTLLMDDVGIKTGWRVIHGSPDFFSITKKIHNALQGGKINITDRKKDIFEHVMTENAVRNHLDHDLVVIHDPQQPFTLAREEVNHQFVIASEAKQSR